MGRPKTGDDEENAIRESLTEGMGILKTAKKHGVCTSVVQRIKASLAEAA